MEESFENEDEPTGSLEDEETLANLEKVISHSLVSSNSGHKKIALGNFVAMEDETDLVQADVWVPSRINSLFQLNETNYTESNHSRDMIPVVLVTHENVPLVAINRLKEKFRVTFISKKDSQEQILQKVIGVSAIFLYGHNLKIDREMLDFIGKQLAVVSFMGDGYDHVDVRELTRRKIRIGNTRTVPADSVSEFAIGLALTVAHRFKEGYLCCAKGKWVTGEPDWLLGKQLSGSVCGIVGFGNIGKAIASKLLPFNVKKIIYSGHSAKNGVKESSVEFVDLDMLLKESDFVFITCPLTDETKHMFNYKTFQTMKPTAVLVNVGRGGVIKTDDLVRALNDKLIWGAGLDDTEPQPLPNDHPLIHLKNCFVTPHIASATTETRNAMALLAADNIIAALKNTQMPCEVCFKPDPRGISQYIRTREPTRTLAKHVIIASKNSLSPTQKVDSLKKNVIQE